MFRLLRNWMAIFVLSLLLVGAQAQQSDGPPWWVWLVGIAGVLLIAFIIVVALAWSSASRRGEK